jgi:hypothetical protein
MPDFATHSTKLDRLFRRLLPRSAGRDWFEPARPDLAVARLQRRGNTAPHALRIALLFAECWGLVLTEALSLRRTHRPPISEDPKLPRPPRPAPKERLRMFLNDLLVTFSPPGRLSALSWLADAAFCGPVAAASRFSSILWTALRPNS